MVNIYNRRLHFMQVKEIMRQGPLMEAPANRLTMLTDYIDPEERSVACPNQDVVYGVGALALDISPVVLQVPDFGDRFWVYQVVDLRTDSFVQTWQDVRHHAGLLSARRAQLEGRGPEGHHQGVPRLHQHRHRRAARLPGRHA